MAIARVAAPTLTEQGTSGTTSFVVSMPATVNLGELLVMAVGSGGGVVSTPAGWTLIGGANHAAAESCYGFYRVAAGSEGGTTVTVTVAAGRATGVVTRYSGVDGVTPIDVAATTGQNAGSGSTCVVASLTTVTNSAFLVSACSGNAATSLTWTQPAGFVTPTTSTSGAGAAAGKGTAYSDGVTIAPPAASGTATWTWNQTGLTMSGWMAALRPSSPPIGVQFLANAYANARAAFEVAFGADITTAASGWTWTDVTGDVMHTSKATVAQGRADETSQAQPASCGFALNNSTGKYTPFSPGSSLYPFVRKGTPVRVRVDFGAGPQVVFFGFAAGFTPVWDASAKLATVAVSAGGLLRRLGSPGVSARSPLYQSIMSRGPVVYWPLEDGSGTNQAAPATTGNALSSSSSASLAFGAVGPAGSESAVDFTGGGTLQGGIGLSGLSSFRLVFAVKMTSTAAAITPVTWTTAAGWTWSIKFDPTGTPSYTLAVADGIGTTSMTHPALSITDTNWHLVQINTVQNGANIDVSVAVDGSAWDTQASFYVGGTPGNPTGITLGSTGVHAFFLAHVGFISPTTTNPEAASALYGALGGYAGELASARVSRLCGENTVPITLVGTSTAVMGVQPAAAFLDLLHECEATDGGALIDGWDAGLVFVALSSRYNLAADFTIDASAGQLVPPFGPVDDDQRIHNDVTASRSGGSSARFVDSLGTLGTKAIGDYPGSITVNTFSDGALYDVASWQVHLGTVEGLRYPTLPLDHVAVPALAVPWLTAGYPGQVRVDVTNITSKATQAPPDSVQLMVEGWSVAFDTVSFQVTANCSPYKPLQVGIWDTSRADSSSSTLASSITNAGTTLSVATANASDLWTTDSTEWTVGGGNRGPLYAICGGEVMQVTNITGASSPQTLTVTRGINGVAIAHASNSPVNVYQPAIAAL